MEGCNINNNSVDSNIESENKTKITNIISDIVKCLFIRDVVLYIIISIGLPLTLVAIYQLYSQVRKDQVAPIYIINLLISKTIQLCTMIVEVAKPGNDIRKVLIYIYMYSLMVSVSFMVCITLERYLLIAWPLWYHFKRNIKTSVVICVVVWILPLLFVVRFIFVKHPEAMQVMLGVFFLLPFPLLIFSLCGTVKALSAAISVPPDEKRRIVAILVLVLLIYTLFSLPAIIWILVKEARNNDTFSKVNVTFIGFSPLADLFLIVFSRKGAVDQFLAFVCRCRMNSDSDVIWLEQERKNEEQ